MQASEETRAQARASRVAWLSRLADEMEKLPAPLPVNPLPENDSPEWVERVESEYAKSMMPAAKLKKGREMTPRRMGALIGHQCSNAVWMMEIFAAQTEKDGEVATVGVNADGLKKGEELANGILEKWYPAMRRYAKRALCSCVDQPFEDMADFLRGFTEGFVLKPKTFNAGNLGTTASEIYRFMLCSWRTIERLKSVVELHQVLIKAFGPYRAGDLKRTEKMCQRIGLHFRKPGRPKKLK